MPVTVLQQGLSDGQLKKLGVTKSDLRRIRTCLDGHSQVRCLALPRAPCPAACLESAFFLVRFTARDASVMTPNCMFVWLPFVFASCRPVACVCAGWTMGGGWGRCWAP